MAITSSLPLRDWYYEHTSEWTLDYPPFFAYFEYILAYFATYFDKEMVKVANLYYDSFTMVVYHRITVIVSDIIFMYACYRYFCNSKDRKIEYRRLAMNYANWGLVILDNIHF